MIPVDSLIHASRAAWLALGALLLSACSTLTSGLDPLEPGLATLFGVPRLDAPAELDSCRPHFRWQAFDLTAARAADPWFAQVGEVRYDLRVWRVAAPSALVYERLALGTNEHELESALEADTVYRWSVRPRFTRSGETRLDEWSTLVGWWRRNPFHGHEGFLIETPGQ